MGEQCSQITLTERCRLFGPKEIGLANAEIAGHKKGGVKARLYQADAAGIAPRFWMVVDKGPALRARNMSCCRP